MVKKFSGQVKISDVQTEFNALVSRINELVDVYNASIDFENIDYSIGSSALGSYNYTLTVGGLKTLMSALDGAVLGFKCFKIGSPSNYKMITTPGVLITEDKFVYLPGQYVNNCPEQLHYWNYDPTDDSLYRTTNYEPLSMGIYRVAESDFRRLKLLDTNDVHMVHLEGSNRKIKVQNKSKALNSSNSLDTSTAAKFINGSEFPGVQWSSSASSRTWERATLFGTEVAYNSMGGSQRRQYWQPVNWLYLPRGSSNPFTYYKHDGEWPENWTTSGAGNTQMVTGVDYNF